MKKVFSAILMAFSLLVLAAYVPIVANPSLLLSMPKFVWYLIDIIGTVTVMAMIVFFIRAIMVAIKWIMSRLKNKAAKK
ncbi:MAG: hypothetical protein J6Y53_00100 [Alphaproteobacteria bacterium]|nr:hypothetical protein [Alphaproteobacteria bacterium]